MDMIAYLDDNSKEDYKLINSTFAERDSFHIGKVTEVLDNKTYNIKSIRTPEIGEVTAMAGIEADPKLGDAVLFLGGNIKTNKMILGRSPWEVGS